MLKDLIARRPADGGDLRSGVTDTTVEEVECDRPTVRFRHDGREEELDCSFVIGCDGSKTEPSRSFTWVATGPGVRTTAGHLLEELGSCGMRVTLAVEPAGPVGVVMGRFYRRLTDRYLTAEAEGNKARSERQV